jgi:hypothetical protein
MMFRHHKDPSYYDPRANDKIFVPDVSDKVSNSLITMVGLDRRAKEDCGDLPRA